MNRFVKDNLVLFIIMGCTLFGALVLLTFAVVGHAKMFRYHEDVKQLRSQIGDLIRQTPAPVVGNVKPMKDDIKFFQEKTAELLPHFGQIKGVALDAFIKELGVDKQKFLETFRAAWEADEDRKTPGGRSRFYERFSMGVDSENNWAADLKLSPAQCLARWRKALRAFSNEYQKLTVEVINEGNQHDILLAVLGAPRNFEGDSERCMNDFILPMVQRMQELCAKPPLTAEEIAQAEAKKRLKKDDDHEDDVFQDKVELAGEAGSFGFNIKVNPRPEELADIAKQGEVIGDLVKRIATSKISALNSFIIRDKYAGEKVGKYVIYHYTFSASGDIARIRNLVKILNDAASENRMYIVRSIFLYADSDGAAELMQIRKEESMRFRDELDGTAAENKNGNPADMGAAPGPMMGGMPGGMPGDPSARAVPVKTPAQLLAEEKAKPYDKREGYGKLLFGGSKNCEAVFDVEYVYLAEPEME